MFQVENNETKKVHVVYDVSYDRHGYPHFLIYNHRQWLRVSAKHFTPIEV